MASIDEILAAMNEADEDGRVILVIDEDLRIITVPNIALVIGAERDKDVNRLWFKMNRYYRGTDLAGFEPQVNYTNAKNAHYYYTADDMTVSEDSVLFSWLIADKAAEAEGTVTFSICMQRFAGEERVQEFNTTTAQLKCLRSIHEEDAVDDASLPGGFAVLNVSVLDEMILG